MIHKYNPTAFFSLLENMEGKTTETVFQFPLEYYLSNNSIILYKFIEGITFSTRIVFSLPLADSEDPIPIIILNGQELTLDQFINDLRVNHNANELLEPLDYSELIIKHNHDMHEHAGVGFDDIEL